MIEEIRKEMEQFHMLEQGDRVLIGFSGGADSVCLTQILYELSEQYKLTLGAIYCHHGIRGEEADEDGRFVKAFCQERGIAFYEAEERVEERARRNRQSVEEAGREFRYECFQRVMQEEGYQTLALAHHADDRAETMLFHLARGTGIAGLCSMEPVRPFGQKRRLIRPLLWVKKSRIEGWLMEKQLSWRIDHTNLSDQYTRNRIRHHIIPEMGKVNDRAVEHMGETADAMSEISSYLKEEEEKVYERAVREQDNQITVSVEVLEGVHGYLQKAVLYRCLAEMAGGRKDVTSGHVAQLLDLAKGNAGRKGTFFKGIQVRRTYESLVFSKKEEMQTEEMADFDENLDYEMRKFPYTGQEILKNEYTKQFDCAKIQNGLCFRFWQQGDYLFLREDGGRKKLSRYFIDAKIPPEQREKILLLADGSHILWIVGYRISAYYKVTDQTETILEVTIKNKG